MSKKKFDISLTLAEFYAIRNALYEMGNKDELLAKINEQIDMLHAYFDGRWHLPRGVRPYLGFWDIERLERESNDNQIYMFFHYERAHYY